nr:MAG TPA: hypothetical protein [Caudoviricetes sp.]
MKTWGESPKFFRFRVRERAGGFSKISRRR